MEGRVPEFSKPIVGVERIFFPLRGRVMTMILWLRGHKDKVDND